MPKFRWGFQTTVVNRLGMHITTSWFGVSFGPMFFGLLKGEQND
jgi:hypothetical protein